MADSAGLPPPPPPIGSADSSASGRKKRQKLDVTQLRALKEFLPTDDERQALKQYLAKATTEEARQAAMTDLCACEQYMVAMMDIPNAAAKFDCMLFKVQFQQRLDEIMDEINKLSVACDEVRSSERLRKLLAIILTVGNQINTGGEGNKQAAGFSLDALLKLDEAKAFDKKTSVLFYLVKLVKENDESLLKFTEDVPNVSEVRGLMIDSLFGDLKQMNTELEAVSKTADEEAEKLKDENGKFINYARKKSLAELQAQKTSVHEKDGVAHYNLMESEDELTDMQFFVKHAKEAMDQSYQTAEEMKAQYIALLKYFGEDEKMPSGDFFSTLNRFLESFETSLDAVNKAEQARIKEEKRLKAQEMKKKMRATVQKGALHMARKAPPSLKDMIDKRKGASQSSTGDQNDKAKPTLAGAAAAALAKTKSKAKEGITQIQEAAGDEKKKLASNPRVALLNNLRKRNSTPTNVTDNSENESAVSVDPRKALLGAIQKKKNKMEEEEITFQDASTSKNKDSRSALMASIKKKGNGSESDAENNKSAAAIDPRSALMASIKSKKVPSDRNIDAKQSEASDNIDSKLADPRALLLASIQGAKRTSKKSSAPRLACIANENLPSRKKSNESASVEDIEKRKSSAQLNHDDSLTRGLVLSSSEAKLLVDELGDNDVGEESHQDITNPVADDLLNQFDKSLKRLDTREADLLVDLDAMSNGDDSGGGLGDLSRELEQADLMMGFEFEYADNNASQDDGIASAAAAAAVARRRTRQQSTGERQFTATSSRSGIAAAAAQAALNRKGNNMKPVSSAGGMDLSPDEPEQKADDNSDRNRANQKSKETAQAVIDPRRAMLDEIAAHKNVDGPNEKANKSSTHIKPAGSDIDDPRSALLSAISSREMPEDRDDMGKSEIVDKPLIPRADPRSAILASITARKRDGEDNADTKSIGEGVSAPSVPTDPRAAMLASIAARKQDGEDDAGEKSTDEVVSELVSKAPVSPKPMDPRAALLASIASRRKQEGDAANEKSLDQVASTPPMPHKPMDPRAAMLASITARKVDTSDSEDVSGDKPTAAPTEPVKSLDPRAAILAEISARKKDNVSVKSEKTKDHQSKTSDGESPAPKIDPRAALLASISSRKVD